MKKIITFLCIFSTLAAENVDIISNFSLDQLCPISTMIEKTGFSIRYLFDFDNYMRTCYSDDVRKIFLMNDIVSSSNLSRLPKDVKEKLMLFTWEPGGVGQAYSDFFSRVYTFNDNLVDGIKYFKFFYPVLTPMCLDLPKFEEKKLCVMVSHSAASHRIKMIKFFETKPADDFEFYGFNPLVDSPRYRGSIPGHPLSQEKFDVLKKYRFCVCFENSFINGYITEKIFACFASGCVPIYYGAPNVGEYIPQDCFIDYRNFQNDEELYSFIKTMPEQTYQQYITNIRKYLQSENAYLFSAEHFSEIIYDATGPLTKGLNIYWTFTH